MKKEILIRAGIGLGGFILGGTGGFFLHKFVEERKNEMEKDQELSDEPKKVVIDDLLDVKEGIIEPPKRTEADVDYDKIMDILEKYSDREPKKEEKNDENDEDLSRIPYSISAEEFNYDTEYSKKYITYYSIDKVFTYENDAVIDDPDSLLGPISSDFLDLKDPDFNESYYFRNEILGSDFCVIRLFGSYRAIVLGESDD